MRRMLMDAILFVCFICCAAGMYPRHSLWSAELPTLPKPPAGPSVGKYLTPDGRIDLKAMRASGYQGSLDLKGFDVRVDRRSGQPVVRTSGSGAVLEHPDDQYWTEGFEIPGVDNGVLALTVYDNKLIAGGWFTAAGGVIANCVAAWDGSAWSPLGSAVSGGWEGYTYVSALTVYDGKLIAGGSFTMAGGVEAIGIAAWDGSAWSPLGAGMNGVVNALTVYDSKLIAGGGFTTAGGLAASRIAAWDGSAWLQLGSGMSSDVLALTVYDNDLVAGGYFTTAGSLEANFVAAWDGSAWSPLGVGMDWIVNALTVYDDKLVAGGEFTMAGGVSTGGIAAWDGSSWAALGFEGGSAAVYALTVSGGELIAGGDGFVGAWDGSAWAWLAYYAWINVLGVYDNKLVAGGSFINIGGTPTEGIPADNIAAWDGAAWSALGSGINVTVSALTVYDGKLAVGGLFTTVGDHVAANRIATWDGTTWSALGSGMKGSDYSYPYVSALTSYNNKLIAGGSFFSAGGVAANGIAAWDGSTWSPLGLGAVSCEVYALAVYDNKLIAGGNFHTAQGAGGDCIAAWDGSAWSPLGSGMQTTVFALTVYDGKLIAGGLFTTAGGLEANHIASWDGSAWSSLGSAMSGGWDFLAVFALTVYDDKLIAGGDFTFAGGVQANGVAAWDGSSWSALGSGMNAYVRALAVYDNKLIAGGWFTTAGGVEANRIAAWDGSLWSPLGSGITCNCDVQGLAGYDTKLMLGGGFAVAGNKVSGYIAQWTKHTSQATLLQSFAASYRGSAVELKWQLSEQVSKERFVIERAERPGDFVKLRGVEIVENALSYSFTDTGIEPGMSCRYRVGLREDDGSMEVLFETEEISIPALASALFQNYPNPFNPSTMISYSVPVDCRVTLDIYDSSGKHVARLLDREKQARGTHSVEWRGIDSEGRAVSSGVYFYGLTSGKKTISRKMVLLR